MYQFTRSCFLITNYFRLALLIAAGFLLLSAPVDAADKINLPPFSKADVPPAPDYADPSSWLAKPNDPDRFAVDIIWIYPTVLYDNSAWLMDITRKDLIAGAEKSVATEARVFSGQANLYAPLYRQMNLAGLFLPEAERDAIITYGENDVRKALQYYLEHYNKGRPFILAAHSQGSYVLTQLIVDHWGKIGVEDQLIAGYVIGWSITEEDLRDNPAITICSEPHQTGCFISYNSVAPGKQKEAPTILDGAVVVNPLTWTRQQTLAPAKLNSGSTFFSDDGTYQTLPGFASAQIADGGLAVVARDPKRLENRFFSAGIYHGYDYPLFFENLIANAAQRIEAFLSKRQ